MAGSCAGERASRGEHLATRQPSSSVPAADRTLVARCLVHFSFQRALGSAENVAGQAAGRAVVAQRCRGSSGREQQLQEMQQGEAPHRGCEQGLAAGEGRPFLGGEGKRLGWHPEVPACSQTHRAPQEMGAAPTSFAAGKVGARSAGDRNTKLSRGPALSTQAGRAPYPISCPLCGCTDQGLLQLPFMCCYSGWLRRNVGNACTV